MARIMNFVCASIGIGAVFPQTDKVTGQGRDDSRSTTETVFLKEGTKNRFRPGRGIEKATTTRGDIITSCKVCFCVGAADTAKEKVTTAIKGTPCLTKVSISRETVTDIENENAYTAATFYRKADIINKGDDYVLFKV